MLILAVGQWNVKFIHSIEVTHIRFAKYFSFDLVFDLIFFDLPKAQKWLHFYDSQRSALLHGESDDAQKAPNAESAHRRCPRKRNTSPDSVHTNDLWNETDFPSAWRRWRTPPDVGPMLMCPPEKIKRKCWFVKIKKNQLPFEGQ